MLNILEKEEIEIQAISDFPEAAHRNVWTSIVDHSFVHLIVHDVNVVFIRELDDSSELILGENASGRILGIANRDQLRLFGHELLKIFLFMVVIVLRIQLRKHRFSPCESYRNVEKECGSRNDYLVPRIREARPSDSTPPACFPKSR